MTDSQDEGTPPPPPLAPVSAILDATRPWVRLMGIVGYISVGIMIVAGVGAGLAGMAVGDVATASLMIVYPLVAVLYIFPAMYLMRYASRINEFVATGQSQMLVAALDAQRSFWKYVAILTLVSLALGLVFAVLAVMVGIVAGMASTGSGGL